MPIQSFSLSNSATKILMEVPRGRKSAFVDNAIHFWKENRDLWGGKWTRDMLRNTDNAVLQSLAWQHYSRIQELEAQLLSFTELNEANTPPLEGKKSLNILTHALNLLKDRLLRR